VLKISQVSSTIENIRIGAYMISDDRWKCFHVIFLNLIQEKLSFSAEHWFLNVVSCCLLQHFLQLVKRTDFHLLRRLVSRHVLYVYTLIRSHSLIISVAGGTQAHLIFNPFYLWLYQMSQLKHGINWGNAMCISVNASSLLLVSIVLLISGLYPWCNFIVRRSMRLYTVTLNALKTKNVHFSWNWTIYCVVSEST